MTVTFTPAFDVLTAAIIGAIFAAYAIVFVLSPLLTEHWLTRSRLILRQGWYFRVVIPFTDIQEIGEADDAGRCGGAPAHGVVQDLPGARHA